MKIRLSAIVVLALLAGCTTQKHVINSAFDDLVNETRKTDTELMKYKSYVSVSGLIPHTAPGTIFHHPDDLSPTHGLGLSPKWSYVVESRYEMDSGGYAKLKTIRDKYVETRDAIVKATTLQVSASLAARSVELARSGKSLEQCKTAAKMTGAPDPKGKDCTDADFAALDGALTTIRKAAVTALAAADGKRGEFIKSVDSKNIVITRWDQRTELTFLGKLAEFFAISIDRKKDIGGVLIAGDLRTLSLRVGEDYIDMVREMDPKAQVLFQQTGIDLFQVQAKHKFYVAEMRLEEAVAASLSLTVEQLESLAAGGLAGTDRIELKLGAAMLTDISNIGTLSAPEHKMRRRCFFPPSENEKAQIKEFQESKGYDTVYQVRGQLTKVDEVALIQTDVFKDLKGKVGDERKMAIKKLVDDGVLVGDCGRANLP